MSEKIYAGKSAILFGSLLVGGFLVVSGLTFLDDRDRETLEVLRETSAVGDPVLFTIPGHLSPAEFASTVVVTVQGKGLYAVDEVKRSDGTMAKAGFADDGKTPLYRRVRNGKLQEALYLRIAPGRYLELGDAPAQPRQKKRGSVPKDPTSPEPN